MSRDPYSSSGVVGPGGGTRSPRSGRRVGELPTVDRSPSRSYASGRGSPLGRKRGTRSGNNSPEHLSYGSYHHHQLSSPFYSRDEDLGSPVMLEERGRSMSTGGGGHHRSRSASRPAMSSSGLLSTRYTSLDRASAGILDHDREFVPIREPRERSRDRGGLYLDDDLYGSRSARQSPNPHMLRDGGMYIGELQHQNNDLQRELGNLKKELELTNQKLGSSMHSIKTFWSPELKKERALRKEESTKYSLINEQLKLLNSENQKQSMMVRQLEEELRLRMRVPNVEVQHEMQVLYNENEHLTREIAILRDTIKELELRIETQKQTLQARDESIKKLLEMLQNKGMGKEEERIMFQQMQSMAQKQDKLKKLLAIEVRGRQKRRRSKQELKATNETLKSLQTQLELAYASTASSGAPVAGSTGTSGIAGFYGSPYNTICNTATHLGGSVAVPGGVPGSTTLTAILETKDARIQTLEKEVSLLEAELQRIRECGGRLREQLLKATAVPSCGGNITPGGGLSSNTGAGIDTINRGHSLSLPSALESLQSAVLTRGPSNMTSLVPQLQTPNSALTNPLLTTSTGGASSCLAGISSGLTTGVVNPYADRHHQQPTLSNQQQHHYHHHHHQYQHQQQQQQHQNAIQQHLKQIEPATAGALALHAHTFNKHDLNFKRQLDELRTEVQRRDQEILGMSAKMKTLEEQHQDYQRHIAVLKESLCAKEEHYNMLQADVEEMRQRLEEKNRLIEKKTQNVLQVQQERNRMNTELTELKDHMDIKDRKINVLQRKIENLEDLLKEKDNQVDMARARLTAMQAHHCSSEGALSSLEEAIGDKEKQMAQLREQRDRAEQEKQEERELHERELAEYKMKIHALESEVEKLGARLERAQAEKDRLEAKLESSQSELGKSKAELDKAASEVGRSGADWEAAKQRLTRLELENERLRHDVEKSSSTFGRSTLNSSQEMDRVQERAEKAATELRRAQAELRVTQADNERARAEAAALQEKVEKSQGEVYRLKARLENAQGEQESLRDEYDRAQATVARLHSERDKAVGELEKAQEELERTQATLGKAQLQQERLQNMLDKTQSEADKLQERLEKSQAEVRRMQMEKEKQNYDFDNLQSQLDKSLGQSSRMQKEREAIQMEVDRLQDKYEKVQMIVQRLQKERDNCQEEISKLQRDKDNALSELELVKERWEKAHNSHQKLTLERDDAVTEIEILKEKLDKAQYALAKAIEERENTSKEFEKHLGKFDRAQSELYRLQNKIEVMEAEKDRLELECEKNQHLATKSREEARKAQEELARVQEMYDRAALQLGRTKENEEKSKEDLDRLSVDLEMVRERYEKSQIELRRLQNEREKLVADNERLSFELERAHSQLNKAQGATEKSQEELQRMQMEIEKMYEKHDRQQAEVRKSQAEAERLRAEAESAREECERYAARFGKYQENQERQKEEHERAKLDVERLRDRLDKALAELDRARKAEQDASRLRADLERAEGVRGKYQFEQEKWQSEGSRLQQDLDKVRERLEMRENELKRTQTACSELEAKLHETQLQLDRAREDAGKANANQERSRSEIERARIEAEKIRDRHDKLKNKADALEADNEKLRVEIVRLERLMQTEGKTRSESASIEVERLRASLDKAIVARDQVELEAGRLAKELEKSQMLMNKHQEQAENAKKEYERIANELATIREERDTLRQEFRRIQQQQQVIGNEELAKLQHDLQMTLRERDKMAAILENREKHSEKIEKMREKLESEAKQLQVERDQLVIQLEKSQDMLMNFQQELNTSEAELERQREEVRRMQQQQQAPDRASKETIEAQMREVHRLTQQVQTLTQQQTKERQRAEQSEKRIQELQMQMAAAGASSANEAQVEQWRKLCDTEKQRADTAERHVNDLQKRIQASERQLHAQQQQIQQMQVHLQQQQQQQPQQNGAGEAAKLRKELERAHEEMKQATVERERFQAQLEMLVQELEKNQVDLHEANKKLQAGATKPGVDNSQERKQLDDQRRQLEEQRKQVEERARMSESRIRAAEEKERMLQNVDQDLKKRKAKMDQLEQQLQKSGGSPDKRLAEMQKTLDTAEKELERAKEEAGRSSAETERLLKLVQMTQEEQNSKEKQIRDLQDALKTAQAKLKQATTAQQQEHIGDKNDVEKLIDEISSNDVELWKRELGIKDTKIRELESEMVSIENFLRDHVDTKGILELKYIIQKKTSKIRKLENTIEEFEDFLKQNPDVKELHDLKRQVNVGDRRIRELENWIERNGDVRIDKSRIMELEEMVTHLEEYVKSHNVDALKQKLQDREERIDQLQTKIDNLEKEIMRREPLKNISDDQCESVRDDELNEQHIKSIKCDLVEMQQKMKEMEHTISEKDNSIQNYEQQLVVWQDKVGKMTDKMTHMEQEIIDYEAEDIGVLKEEIKVRDERIQQLEDEIDSLERAFNDRIDLEKIEELLNVIKDKEEREKQINKDLEKQKIINEELKEAIRVNISISSENERKLKLTEKAKKYALDKIIKLEQRIILMQSVCVLKCHTCKPLILELSKCEKKLKQLTRERTAQLKELHQLKREALKTALSEKDAHLALLELSGVKTASQSNQVEKLRADKEKLLDRLKEEDRLCIELSEEEELSDSTSTASTLLLTKILEPTLTNEEEYFDHISTVNNYNEDNSTQSLLEPTTSTLNVNIHTNGDGKLTMEVNGRQKFFHRHPTIIDTQRKSSHTIRHAVKSMPKIKLTSSDKSSDFRSISSPRLKNFPAEEMRRVVKSPRRPNVFPFPAALPAPTTFGNNLISCQGDSIPQSLLPQTVLHNHNQTMSQPLSSHPTSNLTHNSELMLNLNSINRPPDRQSHRPFVPNILRNSNHRPYTNPEYSTNRSPTKEDIAAETELPHETNTKSKKESNNLQEDVLSDLEKQPVGGRSAALHRLTHLSNKKLTTKLNPTIPEATILHQTRETPVLHEQYQQQMQPSEFYYNFHDNAQPNKRNVPSVGMTSPQDLRVDFGRTHRGDFHQDPNYQIPPVQSVIESLNAPWPQIASPRNTKSYQGYEQTQNVPRNNSHLNNSPVIQPHHTFQEYPLRRTENKQGIVKRKLQFTPAMIRDQELLITTMRQQEIPEDFMRRQFDALLHQQRQQLLYDEQLGRTEYTEEEYYQQDKPSRRRVNKIIEDGKPEWMMHITPPWIPYALIEKMEYDTSREKKKSVRINENVYQQTEQQQCQEYNCYPSNQQHITQYQNSYQQPNYNSSSHSPNYPANKYPTSILKTRNDNSIMKEKPQANNGLQDSETVKRAMEELKNAHHLKGFEYLMNSKRKEQHVHLNGIQDPDDPAVRNLTSQLKSEGMKQDVKRGPSANGLENIRNPNNPSPPPPASRMRIYDEPIREYPRQRDCDDNNGFHKFSAEKDDETIANSIINGYQNNSSAFQNSTVDGNARYKNSIQDQVIYQDKGRIAGHYNNGIPYNLVRSNSLPPNMYSKYQPAQINHCHGGQNDIYNDQMMEMRPGQVYNEQCLQPNMQMQRIHTSEQYFEPRIIGGVKYLAKRTECEPHSDYHESTVDNNIPNQPIAYY